MRWQSHKEQISELEVGVASGRRDERSLLARGARVWDQVSLRPLVALLAVAAAGALAIVGVFRLADTGRDGGSVVGTTIGDLVIFGCGLASIVFGCCVFAISRQRPLRQARWTLALLGSACLGVACVEALHLAYWLGMAATGHAAGLDAAGYFWLAARLAGAIGFLLVSLRTSTHPIIPMQRLRIDLALGAAFATLIAFGLVGNRVATLLVEPSGAFTRTGQVVAFSVAVLSGLAMWRLLRQASQHASIDLDAVSHDPASLGAAAGFWALAALMGISHSFGSGANAVIGEAFIAASSYLVYRGVVRLQLVDVETRHALAVSSAKLGAWSVDVLSGNMSLDSRARGMLGGPLVPPTVAGFMSCVVAEDRAAVDAAWRVAIDPVSPNTLDLVFRTVRDLGREGEGTPAWLHVTGKATVENGVTTRIIGVMQDITDARSAEIALQESAARFQGIISIAVDAIITIDTRQLIRSFNTGAEAIFGYAADDVIGQSLTMLMPERFRAAHEMHVAEFGHGNVAARRMAERAEIVAQRKSGETFHAEASISKLDLAGGRVYTVVLRDITERKEAQTLLEEQIEVRTRELREEMRRREESQEQLVRTQRMEAFGQLTGGVAHDFNNLLTVITGNLELLEMRVGGEKERVLLGRAQEAAEMGARLTSRLLLFARRRTLAPTAINLNEQVLGLAELLERTLGERITVTTSLERHVWTVMADPSEVENAILNLVINARDAMPGGGRLLIETANYTCDGLIAEEMSQALTAGSYVRLSVADTGTGMSEEVRKRAFEPFYSTKEAGRGTGLGLSSVYGLAKAAGGTVSLYSEIGLGTTVNVYLPRTLTDREGTQSEASAVIERSKSGERVLLVEDNAEVRETAKAQLEALGYIVTEAENGQAAVDLMSAGAAFSVVFSDVVMGAGLSGFDVARWVHANRPLTGVLLASGYPDEMLRGEDGRLLVGELLRKPYSRFDLAAALRRAIRPTTG